MGVCVPEEHGGAGADFLAYVLVLEELSRADAGVGVTVAVHTSAGTLPILNHGSEEQIARARARRSRPASSSPRSRSPSPGSGSDAGAMRTRADDDRITGAKQWITNGSFADVFIVFAKEGRPRRRPSSCAPAPRASASPARRRRWGSTRAPPPISRSRPRPRERLGEPGNGMRVALRTLDGGRIGIAAQAVGIAQAALDARRPATPRSATRSAARSRASRRSSTSSPTCRPRSRPPARSSGAPRG